MGGTVSGKHLKVGVLSGLIRFLGRWMASSDPLVINGSALSTPSFVASLSSTDADAPHPLLAAARALYPPSIEVAEIGCAVPFCSPTVLPLVLKALQASSRPLRLLTTAAAAEL